MKIAVLYAWNSRVSSAERTKQLFQNPFYKKVKSNIHFRLIDTSLNNSDDNIFLIFLKSQIASEKGGHGLVICHWNKEVSRLAANLSLSSIALDSVENGGREGENKTIARKYYVRLVIFSTSQSLYKKVLRRSTSSVKVSWWKHCDPLSFFKSHMPELNKEFAL